jgi:hypothetical protein
MLGRAAAARPGKSARRTLFAPDLISRSHRIKAGLQMAVSAVNA